MFNAKSRSHKDPARLSRNQMATAETYRRGAKSAEKRREERWERRDIKKAITGKTRTSADAKQAVVLRVHEEFCRNCAIFADSTARVDASWFSQEVRRNGQFSIKFFLFSTHRSKPAVEL